MNAAGRGALAGALALLWYGVLAEPAGAALEPFRSKPRGQVTVADLQRSGALFTLPPAVRVLANEALAIERKEEVWGLLVAHLLRAVERAEGLRRASAAPAAIAPPGLVIEPEMAALVDALVSRYGPHTLPAPSFPKRDEWPMVDRRTRARATAALVRGPGLDEERAAVILGATLELLAVQARRTEIEAELAEYTETPE